MVLSIADIVLMVTDHVCMRGAGVLLSREEVERAAQLCHDAGAWLIMDNTYEHFVYDKRQHHCVAAPHIIHIFSFSKVPSGPSCMVAILCRICICMPVSLTWFMHLFLVNSPS